MLVLASTSPRRISLLKQLGVPFEAVDPGDAENSVAQDPVEHVREHARCKAEAVSGNYPDRLVIAADTIVVLDGRILEKPRSRKEAKTMLRALCGRTHTVISAIALIEKDKKFSDIRTEETRVTMKGLSEEEIEAYVATGEPMDKAGAYAAQGVGAIIIERVEGCFYNVVGLPMSLLHDMLKDAGINTLMLRK
ncbi:MAG: Maf family protein [Candidatus Bathyarchaeota archaeon]|nr:Maf family protein [Candidatus Bathyarchaeota archaeon]